MSSLPSRPQITSSPGVPRRTSRPAVPTIVQSAVPTITVAVAVEHRADASQTSYENDTVPPTLAAPNLTTERPSAASTTAAAPEAGGAAIRSVDGSRSPSGSWSLPSTSRSTVCDTPTHAQSGPAAGPLGATDSADRTVSKPPSLSITRSARSALYT